MKHQQLIREFKKQIGSIKNKQIGEEEMNHYYDLIRESIQDDIKDGFTETIARNLTLGIGIHSGDYPKYLILNGDSCGWKFITRYLLWQEHILKRLFSYKEVSPRSVGCIIGMAVLWKMNDLSSLSRAYFQFLFDAENNKYKEKETHHLFVAILYDLHETGEISRELYRALPEDNIYRKFLDQWSTADEKELECCLVEICDFHIYSSLERKDHFSEILSLNYFPYEIRLIEKIRAKQGLVNVRIRHPLLETNLASIPEHPPEWDLSEDKVYQFLIEKESV